MKSLTMRIPIDLMFAFVVVSLVACQPNVPTVTPISKATETIAAESTPAPAAASYACQAPDTDWNDRTIFRSGLIKAGQEALERLPGASVYHVDLQIPGDFSVLQGCQQVRYTNQETIPLQEVYFQLFPNRAGGKTIVSEVKVDGQGVDPSYEFQCTALRVPLPLALPPGAQVIIEMNFEVTVALEMGGNYGLFGYFNDVLVLDEFYPVIPVYDDEGWNVKDPVPNGDVTYFDASFYLVRVTAPANTGLVASGVPVSREQKEDNQVVTFAAGPTRDFYLAASDQYTVVSQTVGETTVNSYAFSQRSDHAEIALETAEHALQILGERLGAYQYTEFDVISSPMQALGIEYPGIVGIALDLYDPAKTIWGLPSRVMLESTVAHEVAHQWFYSAVGNDQVDEPWLDEALAQYCTYLYYADAYGEAAAQSYRDSWESRWERVDRADIPIGLPAGDYTEEEYGPIVYGRGPLFVVALAEKMGQRSFDEFLRDYYESNRWGIGTGDAFRQLAEQHCQCDLTALFEEWVYQK